MTGPLRIAMLAHSTNPRGGVVHAMQVAEALGDLGHQVTLFAPDASGRGFFRSPRIVAEAFPVPQAKPDMTAMVEQRIDDYVGYFEARGTSDFDIFHAHDGISGNALATLKQRGRIASFVRTVHHIDEFADNRLMVLQARSVDRADAIFTVSDLWRGHFERQGRSAIRVGNGVDRNRFRPEQDGRDRHLRDRLPIEGGPVFLAIGGVEARKNTLNILKAFIEMRAVSPSAQLVIAGGVSLLDHGAYQADFFAALAAVPQHASAVHLIGAVADEDMPALYRRCDALVFPSVKEGFGLVVLEAMASGLPVVLSSIAPFTEYVKETEAIWCDPTRPCSIADAMLAATQPDNAKRLADAAARTAAAHDWAKVASLHLPVYRAVTNRRAVKYA